MFVADYWVGGENLKRELKHSGVSSLGTVLLCMVVLAGILFVAVSAALSHLQVANAAESQAHARNLAESAIAQALHEISESGTQPAGDTVVTIEGVAGTGLVTFNPGVDSRGYSVFNLEGASSVPGTRGKIVPPRTVHLVGRGVVGSARSYVECLFYRPPFPDGLVASGPVKAEALQLYAIRRDDAYSGGDPGDIASDSVVPGNLFSNYADGWAAGEPTVQLLASSDINGSVGAVGTISLDSSSVVGGEVRPGSSGRPIVQVDIPSKINTLKPNAIPISSSGGGLTLDPDWFSISSGALSVGGDLDLNGSALLVEGDLSIQGAVLGTGVVLVQGDVMIRDGGSAVEAGEQTAIACTGDFSLEAVDPEGNYFKGLVYCEGEFFAKDITVVGATVVNAESNSGARGEAKLENVRFIYNPGSVTVGVSAVLGDADNVGDYTYAFTMMARRNTADDGYEFLVKMYSSSDFNGTKDKPNFPLQWPTAGRSEWQLPLIVIPDTEASAQRLKDEIASALDYWQNNTPGMDGGRTLNLNGLNQRIDEAYNALTGPATSGTSVVSLNLNNILGEWLDTPRVLIWRPLLDEN